MDRGKRKELVGVVISDKMQKTRIVRVERLVMHPKFGKVMRKYSKFKVHDEENKSKAGDQVRIAQTRPISKEKCWRIVEGR